MQYTLETHQIYDDTKHVFEPEELIVELLGKSNERLLGNGEISIALFQLLNKSLIAELKGQPSDKYRFVSTDHATKFRQDVIDGKVEGLTGEIFQDKLRIRRG